MEGNVSFDYKLSAFFLTWENDQKAQVEAQSLTHQNLERDTYTLVGQDVEGFKGPHNTWLNLTAKASKVWRIRGHYFSTCREAILS